jgi:1-acyl-sn-glycerol-3-phosphate acyltransferase
MVIKELGRGFFFVLLVVYGGFAVSLILFPVMFLLFIPSKTVITFRNWFIQSISSIYQEYLAVILQYVGGVNTIIHCESNLLSFENTGVIIFSNHRTVVDWMFVGWSYCSIINKLSTLKVMLKEPLRSVPIFGSIMQMLKFIFLHRKREKDIPHITRILSYLIKLQTYPTILIFPEGTDLSPSNVIKSNTYGDASGLPACQYVLRPKALGALTVLNTVSNFHTNYVVHDITMAYVDHTPLVRPSPISLLLGNAGVLFCESYIARIVLTVCTCLRVYNCTMYNIYR